MALLDFMSDPTTQLGAALLSGQSPYAGVNIGNAFMQVGQLQAAQQKEKRAQDQAELSQLVQTYKILKDQDQQSRTAAMLGGQEYTPNPLLAVHEQKLAQVLGKPIQGQQPSRPPQSMQMPQQAPQAPMGAPMGQPPSQQQAPQQPPSQTTLPALLQGAGISPQMAQMWAGTEKGVEQMMSRLSEVYGPRVVNNLLMQLQPNGQTKVLGGAVSGDVTPVVTGANGPEVLPIKGLQETRAAQAGATTDATEAAKAKYEMIQVPQSDGSVAMVPKAAALNLKPGTGVSVASAEVTQPPRAGSGAAFGVSQTPGAKTQQEGLAKGGVDYKNNLDSTVNVGNDLMLRINESRKALSEFKPGMGAETRLQVARFAQSLGAPKALVDRINLGDVSAKQEFMKLSAQQAMESLKQSLGGAGRITQAEFKVFQDANPNIALDPQAIEKIFAFTQKVHARNVSEQSSLSDYLSKGGNLSQWPAMWTQQQMQSGLMNSPSGFKFLGRE